MKLALCTVSCYIQCRIRQQSQYRGKPVARY